MKYRNQLEINQSVSGEKLARGYMLAYYAGYGLKVINTNGTREQDIICLGVSTGRRYRVEEKYRRGDFGDFLIELFQDMNALDLGWYFKTRADLLAYIVCDSAWIPQRSYIVRFAKFKVWWMDYMAKHTHPAAIVSSKGIGVSLNLSVSWLCVPREIYETHLHAQK